MKKITRIPAEVKVTEDPTPEHLQRARRFQELLGGSIVDALEKTVRIIPEEELKRIEKLMPKFHRVVPLFEEVKNIIKLAKEISQCLK